MTADEEAVPLAPPAADGPGRRQDPRRRDRIIDACLDVIAARGVDGVSHRRVAAEADVPLGSMTYHFSGRDELLREAFARFIDGYADRFDRRMAAANTTEEAARAVVDTIEGTAGATRRDLVLTHELYTLAARDDAYRQLTDAWMSRSRASLARHFDALTSRLLDALIEGVSIHAALDPSPRVPRVAVPGVERITGLSLAPSD